MYSALLNSKNLGPIYLSLAASIWGGLYVVSKIALDVISPLELLWLRYAVGFLTLLFLGICTGQSWKMKKQDVPLFLSIGVIGYFLSIWAQFAGTQLTSAQMGSMITSATPAFMVLFARLLLKEEFTLQKLFAVFLATLGVLCIVGVGNTEASSTGGLILVGAALTWALSSVLIKRCPAEYSALVITAYGILIAFIVMTPVLFQQLSALDFHLLTQPTILGSIFYLGVIATAGAFYFWNRGLQLVEAGKGSLYFFLQPVVGSLLGWLCLGEQVTIWFWLGSFLILTGVLLVMRKT